MNVHKWAYPSWRVPKQMLYLVAIDHEVMCCDERLEDNHPAGVGGPLEQRVGQLRDVHVHLIGALNQIYNKKCKRNVKLVVCVEFSLCAVTHTYTDTNILHLFSTTTKSLCITTSLGQGFTECVSARLWVEAT